MRIVQIEPMQFRLSENDIMELAQKIQKVEEYNGIPHLLREDARVLVLFRLNCGLNRAEFAKRFSKSVNTIANLERGNKKIITSQKAQFYANKLQEFAKLPLNSATISSNYNRWLDEDLKERAKRACDNAHVGGFAAARAMSTKQRRIRARKGGIAAKMKHAGIHSKRHLWMAWFKKGLTVTGKRLCIGPRGEKMVNSLERAVAVQLFESGIIYQYEPLLKVDNKTFYPDFKTGCNIIECCYWESEDRWLYLATKFSRYHGAGFKCLLVTKESCKQFFHLIPDFVKIATEDELHDITAYLLPYGCQPPR